MTSAWVMALLLLEPTVVERNPTDDVWVYPHASDVKDAYLRVWGANGKAVAGRNDALDEFSYSYLRFDLAGLPAGTPKEAKLILTATADPGWTADDLKSTPIQARVAASDFREKDWSYDALASKLAPSEAAEAVLGVASASPIEKGKEPTLTIDLLQGPAKFADALSSARKSGALVVALTSALNPAEVGRTAIYKFYSKDGPEKFRPVLRLTFD